MDKIFLETVELRASKERSSIGIRLTRETAEDRRSDLEADGWAVRIGPIGAADAPEPSGVQTRPTWLDEDGHRAPALETRIPLHTRAVREHLQAAWERAEANRWMLDWIRRELDRRVRSASNDAPPNVPVVSYRSISARNPSGA